MKVSTAAEVLIAVVATPAIGVGVAALTGELIYGFLTCLALTLLYAVTTVPPDMA